MQQQQQQAESSFLSIQSVSVLLMFVARIFSMPVTVLLHTGYGSRFLGYAGVLAVLPFLTLAVLFQGNDPAPLMCLLLLYIGRVIAGRLVYLYRLVRGRAPKIHTRYAGQPLLARVLPNWSEDALLWAEPLGVLLVGCAVIWLNKPLGCYLIMAGIASAVWHGLMHLYTLNKTLDMNDAALEQQSSAERFRAMSGR